MKPKFVLLILSTLLAMTMMACVISIPRIRAVRGSGNVVRESRDVSGFDEVSVGCGFHLFLTQGERDSVEIEAEDNLLPYIEAEVKGGRLVVCWQPDDGPRSYSATRPVNVYLSMVDIHSVDISGGGELQSQSIQGERLRLDASGGSDLNVDGIQVDELRVVLSGGSDMESAVRVGVLSIELSGGSQADLSGQAGELKLDMSGGGDFNAQDLACETADIHISGGGTAYTWVSQKMSVNLSGGSLVHYYGTPAIDQSEVSGGSRMISEGEKPD